MRDKNKSFFALLATQFFGAFNDNLFKFAVGLLVVDWVTSTTTRNNWISLSNFLFVAPFLAFSLVAGSLADRWSKTRVIRLTKFLELGVVAVASAGMLTKNIPLMMAGLAFLAFQSTFFAPAKYGILPELLSEKKLSHGNGILNALTVAAILAGTIVASLFIDNHVLISIVMGVVAFLGLASSFFMEELEPRNPTQPLRFNPITEFRNNWGQISSNLVLRRSLVAVSFFWFLGSILILNTILYVNDLLLVTTKEMGSPLFSDPQKLAGILLLIIGVGVGLGSLLAGRLSREKVEIGLVPLGALFMSLFTIDLFFAHHSLIRTLIDGFFLGISSGFFFVPLNTLIQARSDPKSRGRTVATANFVSFIAIAMATPFMWFFGSLLHFDPAQVFLVLGLLSLIVTVVICRVIPQAVVRLLLYILTNTIYRIRVRGRENIPLTGPALLVPNHVSLVDPFLVAGSISRQIRFLMFRELYERPWIQPLVKLMETIPISSEDNPKEIMKSLIQARKKLEAGHLVCIFSEGQISRLGGSLLEFKRGTDVILKGLDVPVIPIHLEGAWGSIFSFKGKKFIWKWPKKIPYPITVTIGKPLTKPGPQEIRQAVSELGSQAFAFHHSQEKSLFSSTLRQAKRFPNQKIVADSSGKELTYRQLLITATWLGKKLKTLLPTPTQKEKAPFVGVLLPPGLGAVLTNLALTSQGYVPININYTLSKEGINGICEKAGLTSIVTAKKLLSHLGMEPQKNHLFIEQIIKTFSSFEKIKTALLITFLPRFLLEKTIFSKAPKRLEDLASVIFTSGSTGVPKGVMLTQANILSNIQSLTMILQLDHTDVILGALPFFHSFGFTATLWFPLLAGFKGVYHNNPLDSKTIAELCRTHKVTFLLGTPTFMSAYIRRINPDDFQSLKFAIVGAEKLRPELAHAFEEKYKVPLMEGYGCTELSPVVALNIPDIVDGEILQVGRKVGKIGRPIPGVAAMIVDPETLKPLKAGQAGLLLITGPNVMKGYLGDPEKTAEVLHEGWYITGDIAKIDEDGFIEITDRLSRFSKIGGEMVPHLMIEQKLQEAANATELQFVVTSVPDIKKGEALAVLVSNPSLDIDQLWKNLQESDMPKLWIPSRDHFVQAETIPLLGSGKVDMQSVKNILLEKLK